MKENLNVGTRIDGAENQTDNSTIEKYCYDDQESNCDEYGGLYQWNEMMQYTTTEGVQGICPIGWHLPSDAEWCVLTQNIDATVNCNSLGSWTGTDAGYKMKSITGWYNGGNGNNSSGFSALPGSNRDHNGGFYNISLHTNFWASTQYSLTGSYTWHLYFDNNDIGHNAIVKEYGLSIRCILD